MAIAGKSRAGVLYFKINGQQYDLSGDMTVDLGNPKRESIMGPDGNHGFKETPMPPFIEGTFVRNPGLPLAVIQTFTNSTVTVNLDDGYNYVLAGAFSCTPVALKPVEGTYGLRFEGTSMQEIV